LLVVVQILVSQRQSVDPLGHQLLYGMVHEDRIAPVQETMVPPSNRAITWREKWAANSNVDWLHSHSGSRSPFWPKHVVVNMFMPQDPAFRHPLCEISGLKGRLARAARRPS
jgi:hypothetical protein